MPQVVSRVNGLKITIPNDARNVVHRFAIGGGGNELIFEPMKRSDFNKSAQEEAKPVGFGADEATVASADGAVELSINLVDDDQPEQKPKRARRRKAVEEDATDDLNL